MSTSNTTPVDQRIDPSIAAELRKKRKKTIQSSLARRHRKEKPSVYLVSLRYWQVCSLWYCCSGVFYPKVCLHFGKAA